MKPKASIMTLRAMQRGMTLLEVVLAVTLAVAVLGGTLRFYHHALTVRTKLESAIHTIEVQGRLMDHISAQLRCAAEYRFLGVSFQGDPQELRFVTAKVPGPHTWAFRSLTDDPVPPEQDLQQIGYRLRVPADDANDEGVVRGIEQTHQKVLAVRVVEDPRGLEPGREQRTLGDEDASDTLETTLIGPGIEFLRFRYFRNGAWTDRWFRGSLPLGVEITLGVKPLPEGSDIDEYPYEVMRRVVYLPGSTERNRGTIIRRDRGGSP